MRSRRTVLLASAAILLAAAWACSTFSSDDGAGSDGGSDATGDDGGGGDDAGADAAQQNDAEAGDATRIGADDAGQLRACAVRGDAVFLGYVSSTAGLRRLDRATGGVTPLASGAGIVDVVADDFEVYWLTDTCNNILLESDGTPDATPYSRTLKCQAARLTLAGNHVFVSALTPRIFETDKAPTPNVVDVEQGGPLLGLTGAIASDDVRVFVGMPDSIVAMNAVADAGISSFVDAGGAIDIVYEPGGSKIFWATNSEIGTVSLDGGDPRRLYSNTHAARLTVDATEIVWTDNVANRIWRLSRTGKGITPVEANGKPVGIAIEPASIVWCNENGEVWSLPR